jgi:hypothetical protein
VLYWASYFRYCAIDLSSPEELNDRRDLAAEDSEIGLYASLSCVAESWSFNPMKQQLPASAGFRIGGFIQLILPAAAILVVGAGAIFSILIYKISHPEAVPEAVNPSYYLMPSLEVNIPSVNDTQIPAWWIPGLKGAPGIILATGYGMNRSDGLSLAAVLHQDGFNLLVFSQRGSYVALSRASTLGLYEAEDMLNAVRFLQKRPESNGTRVGIWGVDVSARGALKAAATFPEIQAIAADSVFDLVSDFLDFRIAEDFGLNNRIIAFGCYQVFRLAYLFSGIPMSEQLPLQAISDRAVLFIKGDNRKLLGSLTAAVYDKVLPQKEMISLKTARIHLMSGEDLRNYDRQVASFFHLNLQ